ncbi:MAG: hypothetical protein R3C60_04425 [Parvularculaceae bacterium]
MIRQTKRYSIALFLLLAGCATGEADVGDLCPTGAIREQINAEIQKGVAATRDQDIDAYMDGIPDAYRIVEDDGSITDKEMLREYALKSWAIIDKTIALEIQLNSIAVAPDCSEATVYTSQRWERIMRRRTGDGADNVVTTQTHRELWRKAGARWLNYEIVELGGKIFVNGEPYTP